MIPLQGSAQANLKREKAMDIREIVCKTRINHQDSLQLIDNNERLEFGQIRIIASVQQVLSKTIAHPQKILGSVEPS